MKGATEIAIQVAVASLVEGCWESPFDRRDASARSLLFTPVLTHSVPVFRVCVRYDVL